MSDRRTPRQDDSSFAKPKPLSRNNICKKTTNSTKKQHGSHRVHTPTRLCENCSNIEDALSKSIKPGIVKVGLQP